MRAVTVVLNPCENHTVTRNKMEVLVEDLFLARTLRFPSLEKSVATCIKEFNKMCYTKKFNWCMCRRLLLSTCNYSFLLKYSASGNQTDTIRGK